MAREGGALEDTAEPGLLPPQRPFDRGDDWTVAFAPGDGSALASGVSAKGPGRVVGAAKVVLVRTFFSFKRWTIMILPALERRIC